MISLDQGGRGARAAVRHTVPAPLRGSVEEVCVLPGAPEPGADRWRVVADPCSHVMVTRLADGRTRTSIVGPRSRWVDVDHTVRAHTVCVRLAPGALSRLGRVPAHEFADRGVTLSASFGREGREVTKRLEDAESPSAALGDILAFLGRRLADQTGIDWRVRGYMAALAAEPGTSVADAAGRMGVSPRTLREVLREHVGLGPKRIQRVHRLLSALTRIRRDGAAASEAAHAVGCVDHAHLVHECRAMLGETPAGFLARARGADSYKTSPSRVH